MRSDVSGGMGRPVADQHHHPCCQRCKPLSIVSLVVSVPGVRGFWWSFFSDPNPNTSSMSPPTVGDMTNDDKQHQSLIRNWNRKLNLKETETTKLRLIFLKTKTTWKHKRRTTKLTETRMHELKQTMMNVIKTTRLWWTDGRMNNNNNRCQQQRESESDFLHSVLLWNNHLPIRYLHRQSGSTAYRQQARPAPTVPGLRSTAIPRPNLPFNGLHLRNPCNLHGSLLIYRPQRDGRLSWHTINIFNICICDLRIWIIVEIGLLCF